MCSISLLCTYYLLTLLHFYTRKLFSFKRSVPQQCKPSTVNYYFVTIIYIFLLLATQSSNKNKIVQYVQKEDEFFNVCGRRATVVINSGRSALVRRCPSKIRMLTAPDMLTEALTPIDLYPRLPAINRPLYIVYSTRFNRLY